MARAIAVRTRGRPRPRTSKAETLRMVAQAIARPGTWASEFEVAVTARLLARRGISLLCLTPGGCTRQNMIRALEDAEHDASVLVVCDELHYQYVMCDGRSLLSVETVKSNLAVADMRL